MRKLIKLALTVVFVLSAVVCYSQSVTYEPYGPMDKSLPTIVVKMRHKDSLIDYDSDIRRFVYVLYINKKDYNKLKKYIKRKNTKIAHVPDYKYSYGTYKVTYTDDKTTFEYMLTPNKESRIFFEEQLHLITSNCYLYEELQLLIRRL